MIRVALTSKKQTPSLFEIQKVLGIDKVRERINNFINLLERK